MTKTKVGRCYTKRHEGETSTDRRSKRTENVENENSMHRYQIENMLKKRLVWNFVDFKYLTLSKSCSIYPIICLKSVCLATFAECSSQFLIVRLGRCLKLIASTRGTFCHEFAPQFGLELFLYGKNRKPRSTGPPQSIAALWQIDN